MSTYLTAYNTTTYIKTENINTVKVIIQALASGYPSCYEWRDIVTYADSLEAIFDELCVIYQEIDGGVMPIFNNTYKSSIFKQMLPHIAPYMQNGKISGKDSDGNNFLVTFRDGVARINGKIATR